MSLAGPERGAPAPGRTLHQLCFSSSTFPDSVTSHRSFTHQCEGQGHSWSVCLTPPYPPNTHSAGHPEDHYFLVALILVSSCDLPYPLTLLSRAWWLKAPVETKHVQKADLSAGPPSLCLLKQRRQQPLQPCFLTVRLFQASKFGATFKA